MTALGESAEKAITKIIDQINSGTIEIKSRDAGSLIKVLHSVSRLEAGQVQQLSGTIALDASQVDSAIAALEQTSRARREALDAVPEVIEAVRADR